MLAKRGVYLLVFLIAVQVALAQTVTRSADPTEVYVSGQVEISLTVSIGNADAYAIDESLPSGWVVVDPGYASTNHSNHLKWLVMGSSYGVDCQTGELCMGSTTLTYTLQAPDTTGTGSISGQYMFDVDNDASQISTTTITVVDLPPTSCTPLSQTDCNNNIDCTWCTLSSICMDSVECNSATCVNSSYRCSDNCRYVACASGSTCLSNVCELDTNDNNTNNTNNNTDTCTSNWNCTTWTPAICPESRIQTHTCTDLNGCEAAYDESRTCRVSRTTDGGGSSGGTTTGTTSTSSRVPRTSTTSSTGTQSSRATGTETGDGTVSSGRKTGGGRSTAPELDQPSSEEMMEETKETADTLFWVLLVVLVLMGIGIFLYFKRRGSIQFNGKVDLSQQKNFVKQQQNSGAVNQNAPGGFKPF